MQQITDMVCFMKHSFQNQTAIPSITQFCNKLDNILAHLQQESGAMPITEFYSQLNPECTKCGMEIEKNKLQQCRMCLSAIHIKCCNGDICNECTVELQREATEFRTNKKPKNAKADSSCQCGKECTINEQCITCANCTHIFHFKCVNIAPNHAHRIYKYICPKCQQETDKHCQNNNGDDLFCWCFQVYDAKQEMIGCETCGNWYHFKCIKKNKKDFGEDDKYSCDMCTMLQGTKKSANKSTFSNVKVTYPAKWEPTSIRSSIMQSKQKQDEEVFMSEVVSPNAPDMAKQWLQKLLSSLFKRAWQHYTHAPQWELYFAEPPGKVEDFFEITRPRQRLQCLNVLMNPEIVFEDIEKASETDFVSAIDVSAAYVTHLVLLIVQVLCLQGMGWKRALLGNVVRVLLPHYQRKRVPNQLYTVHLGSKIVTHVWCV